MGHIDFKNRRNTATANDPAARIIFITVSIGFRRTVIKVQDACFKRITLAQTSLIICDMRPQSRRNLHYRQSDIHACFIVTAVNVR